MQAHFSVLCVFSKTWIIGTRCNHFFTLLQIDKPATFTVSFNGASGQLHSYVRTPSGGHEDCFIQEMDTGLYAIRLVSRLKVSLTAISTLDYQELKPDQVSEKNRLNCVSLSFAS